VIYPSAPLIERTDLIGKIDIVLSSIMHFRYRLALGIFILGLVLSGISALPLQSEVSILDRWLGSGQTAPNFVPGRIGDFISFVHSGIQQTYAQFPFFGYGTDWLGFGHFVIAAFFILPFIDPIKYRAVLHVGLAACVGVIVLALISGSIRGIPFFWTLIDCSFGIFGAIPLLYCLRLTK
jgi:hypothetical protein